MEEKKVEAAPVEEKPKKKKRQNILSRKYLKDFTPEKDIKYRGPLSYRHLRIIAWITLTISQIGVIFRLHGTLNHVPLLEQLYPFFNFFSTFMAPLFLIAAFSVLLNAKDGYRRLLILYGGLTILVFFAFLIVYQHYFLEMLTAVVGDEAQSTLKSFMALAAPGGYITFNFFLDLFLCTLVTFFLNYTPEHYFQGKKLIIFRLFAILPSLYELGSLAVKILASNSLIEIHPLLFPLLTTKPPVTFLIFVMMAFFIKNREKYFLKVGKTHEDYEAYQTANLHSLQFSVRLTISILLAAIIDVVLFFALSGIMISVYVPTQEMSGDNPTFIAVFNAVYSWGFLQTLPLLLIIPLVLLFDYKKTYKNSMIDIVIPVAGVAMVVLVYLEGGFQIVRQIFADSQKEPDGEDAALNLLEKAKGVFLK
jgi:hypothetical protein